MGIEPGGYRAGGMGGSTDASTLIMTGWIGEFKSITAPGAHPSARGDR
jgi:hypothetical protein